MSQKKSTSPSVGEKLKKVFNHYIIKNVLILFFLTVFLFYGMLVLIRHYTHHGEALPVPDVTGMSVAEAGKLLEAQKMRWHLSDSIYVTSVKPGAVVNQNPEPGTKVKENRNVFLTMNALASEKITMPNVVDLSFRQAKTMLESQGLMLGKLTYVPDIAKDYVLKQLYRGKEIRKGTQIPKGSEIQLVLGRGLSDTKGPVPDLIGNTLQQAKQSLIKYFLNISVIYDHTVITGADTLRATVYQQRPEATDQPVLQLGASVDVWMTAGDTQKPNTVKN